MCAIWCDKICIEINISGNFKGKFNTDFCNNSVQKYSNTAQKNEVFF